MKSVVLSPLEYRAKILSIIETASFVNHIMPERFLYRLENHHTTTNETGKDGMPLRNPLIVALGDSVTAGAFEGSKGLPQAWIDQYSNGLVIDTVIDPQHVYHRLLADELVNRYPTCALSVINAGICGDTVVGMNARLDRDVLCHQPDLVIFNASLNGPADLALYESHYRQIIERIQSETNADIILMTPNTMVPDFMGNLDDRISIIRSIAAEKCLPLADAYAVWVQIEKYGIELKQMLSNGINHPTTLGHELYAWLLLRLFPHA